MSNSIKRTKEILNNYLAEGKILIAIDSNTQGTVLPSHLMKSIQVKLNLSYTFKTNVFTIDDEKVEVDLSFQGVRTLCRLPLESIYYVAMANNPLDGVEIIEHLPIELLEMSYEMSLHEDEMMELKEKQIDFMSEIPEGKASEIESRLNIAPKGRAKKSSTKTVDNTKVDRQTLEEMVKAFDDIVDVDDVDFLSLIPKDKAQEIETRLGIDPETKKQNDAVDTFLKPIKNHIPNNLRHDLFDEFVSMLSSQRLQDKMREISSLVHKKPTTTTKRRINKKATTKLDNEIHLSDFLKPKKQ